MLNLPSHCHTVEDYLRFDRRAEGRYEYREGDILAMLPGAERHVLIVTNVVGDLRLQLKGRPCKVYSTCG